MRICLNKEIPLEMAITYDKNCSVILLIKVFVNRNKIDNK